MADAIDSWSCPTTVHVGPGSSVRVLAGLAGTGSGSGPGSGSRRGVLLVIDAAVARARPDLVAAVGPTATVVSRDPGEVDLAVVDRVLAAAAEHPGAHLVAVGGGSVLDAVKVAGLLLAEPAGAGRPAAAGNAGASPLRGILERRDGLVLWPAASRSAASDVVCVPTTVGTAAEVSPIAMMRRADGMVMIAGAGLRPRVAVLDAEATATAPRPVLVAGLVEALGRVVVPAAAGQRLPVQDAMARALADTLLVLASSSDRSGDPSWREAAALASTQTHTAFTSVGRSPFGHVLWPVATELAAATGASKGVVLAALLPAWLDGLAGGRLGPVFGGPDRAAEILGQPVPAAAERIRSVWPALVPGPDATRDAAPSVDDVVSAIVSRWQAPGPFLAGVPREELTALVAAAVGSHLLADRH